MIVIALIVICALVFVVHEIGTPDGDDYKRCRGLDHLED